MLDLLRIMFSHYFCSWLLVDCARTPRSFPSFESVLSRSVDTTGKSVCAIAHYDLLHGKPFGLKYVIRGCKIHRGPNEVMTALSRIAQRHYHIPFLFYFTCFSSLKSCIWMGR